MIQDKHIIKCPYCDNDTEEDSKFCDFCARPIHSVPRVFTNHNYDHTGKW